MATKAKRAYLFAALVFVVFFFALPCAAQQTAEDFSTLPAFTKADRVLILAPHPDDESIGTAGVIQQALSAGATVYAACYTNGDANELAFIIYEKRITFFKGEFLHMGEVRRKETIAALRFLGVDEDKISFLGYPDVGTMQIMLKFWGAVKPYRSLLTRVTNVPYDENLSPGAAYTGENILKDIKTVLTKARPTKIFVSHPLDTNGDHQSLYLVLRVALWDLEGRLRRPEVYPYLVHWRGWPRPRRFNPESALMPPDNFAQSQVAWQKTDLSEEQIKRKHEALGLYKSQIPYNPFYLKSFARKNELFGDQPFIILKPTKDADFEWQATDQAGFLSYAKTDNTLYIKLSLDRGITKAVATSVNLLGYSKKTAFANMPKVRLLLTRNKLIVYNKKSKIFVDDATMDVAGNNIIIKFPLVALNSPAYILSRVRANTRSMPLVCGGWRVLKVER
jgi:LmbE family N-acetylglucosaminyl deacetylase